MLYFTMTSGGQHVPSMKGCHAFWIGLHWIQTNSALSPMPMLVVMMQNQINFLIQPSVRRNKVRAKLVLDQMAAVMDSVPPMLIARMVFSMVGMSNGTS